MTIRPIRVRRLVITRIGQWKRTPINKFFVWSFICVLFVVISVKKFWHSFLFFYMDSSITNCTESNNQLWCSLDSKLQLHGNCLTILDETKMYTVKYSNGKRSGTGYLLNNDLVTQEDVYSHGNLTSTNSYSPEFSIVDIDTGTRFEGLVYDNKPYGFGEFYDDDGIKVYTGIMINWKRYGYGVNYYKNGVVEYEGYWVDDKYHGRGRKYAFNGQLLFSGNFIDGNLINPDYNGNGKNMNTVLTHVILSSPLWLTGMKFQHYQLESIDILCNCSCQAKKCCFSDMPVLTTLHIQDDCFRGKTSLLFIENCPLLNSIVIGKNSFPSCSLKVSSILVLTVAT